MQAVEFFKALSDPTRLKLLLSLRDVNKIDKKDSACLMSSSEIDYPTNSLCVCDLTTLLEQPQPTISRHLNHLLRVGVLTKQRRGTWMWYQISEDLPDWCQKVIEKIEIESN